MKRKIKHLILRILQWFIIVLVWALWLTFWLSPFFITPYALLVQIFGISFYILFHFFTNLNLKNRSTKNIIVSGQKGSGKGVLFQHIINLLYGEVLSNLDFGQLSTQLVSPDSYFNSIAPNSFSLAIKDEWRPVDKHPEWEGLPYFLDDSVVYFPNYEDAYLKKHYQSMGLFLVTQRHLYNSYTVINSQILGRSWKLLRELEMDGYINVLGNLGFGYIASRLPYFRKNVIVRYRYYDKLESAESNLLPFGSLGVVNRSTDPLYTTNASALKKQYQATNGTICNGVVIVPKKSLKYDTRYFHKKVFGFSSKDDVNVPWNNGGDPLGGVPLCRESQLTEDCDSQ